MKKYTKKEILIYIATIIFSVVFILVGSKICAPVTEENTDENYYKAKVISVGETVTEEFSLDDENTMVTRSTTFFEAEIKNGEYKGEVVQCAQDMDYMYAYNSRDVAVGDSILIAEPSFDMETEDGEETWIFIEHNRIGTIVTMCIVFFLLIIMIGRLKGISTILSLLFAVLSVFMVYIPSLLKGFNIYVMTVIVALFMIFMSLIIINGWNKKTLCAVFGNTVGIAIAGVLTVIMTNALGLTGIIDEDYVLLTLLDNPINLRGIVWGSVVIGALGAVMDVSMTIASAMNEFNDTMEGKSFKKMLRSGMNIGRDAIGTMTNTLILAYIGGALATVLLLMAYNKNILYLFNMEMIMAEIIQAVVGSIGILAAVPATAIFSAYVFNKKKDV